MPDHDYKTGGLRQKYNVTKRDGSEIDPEAVYFVLRVDADKHARNALVAYADTFKMKMTCFRTT